MSERSWQRYVTLIVGIAIASAAIAACGSSPRRQPAAEPAASPPATHTPAGRSVRVGAFPEGIAVDPRTELVAVATRNPNAIVLFDARTGRVRSRVLISGAPRHLALTAPGGPLLVPVEPADLLLRLTLPDGRSSETATGRQPHAATAAAGRVFVGNEFGHGVIVIAGRKVIARVGGFVQPGGLAAVGNQVAVVDVGGDTVTLIDANTLRRENTSAAGAGPTHVVGDPEGHAYVIDTRGNAILTYETRPRLRQTSRLKLPGTTYGVAIDTARHRIWVTLTATNQLVELATTPTPLRVTTAYPTGRQPNTVAADPRTGRVFVANAGDGTVELIDPRR